MKTAILSAASALVLVICVASAPALAMPGANTLGVSSAADGLTQVRWRRHHHYRHHRYRRHYGHSRRASPSQAGNAKDPSRPIRQQNQGMTTGGPRY